MSALTDMYVDALCVLQVLKDADILLSPHTFHLREVEYWLQRTNASVVTPSIAPVRAGHRAGRVSVSTGWQFGAGCLAVRQMAAEMVKVSTSYAFERYMWKAQLEPIADDHLATDSYMMSLWCILSEMDEPSRPGCVLLRHEFGVHANERTIRKSGTLEDGYHHEKADAALKAAVIDLYRLYPSAFLNYSWSSDTYKRTCWSIVEEEEESKPTKMGKSDGHSFLKPLGDVRPTRLGAQHWGQVMKERQQRIQARAAARGRESRAAPIPKA
jgi:hypothetical protein